MHVRASMASSEITLEAVPSVGDVPADEWDACANPPASPNGFNGLDALASPGSAGASCADSKPYYNPFVSHAFFAAAENLRLGHRPHRLGRRGICWRKSTAGSPASCPAI